MKKLYFKYYLAASVSLLTFLVYLSSLQNKFVNWDDTEYILENPHIPSFNLTFLRWAFFDFYASNWHPLTWISHALDYAVWGLNPMGHHLTNNILHAVNTFLVVVLVVRLMEAGRKLVSNKISPNPSRDHNSPFPPLILRGGAKPTVGALSSGGVIPKRGTSAPPSLEKGDRGGFSDNSVLIVAATTGLLFGLHPIHVESVVWVAERKDLLCGLFFLLSIMAYVKYAGATSHGAKGIEHSEKNNMQRAVSSIRYAFGPMLSFKGPLLYALCFFVLALMSKPMAVSLPAVLLILDWYPFKRITSFKTFRIIFIEKIPFILLGLLSSILTIMAQESGKALQSVANYPLSSRVFVAAKSLFDYLWKIILPVDLVPFYPYPEDISAFSLEYLSVIALPLLFTAACVVIAKKQKLLTSVWGYYVVTLIPVLGIVQVGGQSMADRYTYLPSLGPFLIMGLGVAWVSKRAKAIKKWGLLFKVVSVSAAIVAVVSMTYLTLKQIHIWKNSIDLWSYVIEKEPGKVCMAYMNRSAAFCEIGLYDKAISDYDTAVAIAPFDPDVYYGKGMVFSEAGQFEKAIFNYGIALTLSQDVAGSFFGRELIFLNRGIAYFQIGQRELALNDFKKACDLGNNVGCQHLRNYGAMGAK